MMLAHVGVCGEMVAVPKDDADLARAIARWAVEKGGLADEETIEDDPAESLRVGKFMGARLAAAFQEAAPIAKRRPTTSNLVKKNRLAKAMQAMSAVNTHLQGLHRAYLDEAREAARAAGIERRAAGVKRDGALQEQLDRVESKLDHLIDLLER